MVLPVNRYRIQMLDRFRFVRTFIGFSICAAAFYYLSRLILQNVAEIQDFDFAWEPYLIVALLVSVFANFLNSVVWHLNLQGHGVRDAFVASYWAWIVGRICRYVPGKVLGYAVRVNMHSKVDRQNVLAASVTDLIVSLLPIGIVAFILMLTTGALAEYFSFLLLLILVLAVGGGVFFYCVRLFQGKKVGVGYEAIKQIDYRMLLISSLLMCFLMALHGIAFFIQVDVFASVDIPSYWVLTFCLLLSGLIGQLSVLVPAGLGVREAALVFTLTQASLPVDVALIVSICSRLVLVLAEIVNLMAAFLLKRSLVA